MKIEWTGTQTTDPETQATVLQARADGKSVAVHISQEVIDDWGLEAARDVAARKILAATTDGKPPEKVLVLTTDFAPSQP